MKVYGKIYIIFYLFFIILLSAKSDLQAAAKTRTPTIIEAQKEEQQAGEPAKAANPKIVFENISHDFGELDINEKADKLLTLCHPI